MTLGRVRLAQLQHIQDAARSRILGWQGKLISIEGRRELIRSVVTALPVYLMTAIKPPKKFIKEFDKMRRLFLWAGDGQLMGGKCKVAWTAVSSPTAAGGLGIKDLDRFSRALRVRWLWFAWEPRARPWKGLPLPAEKADLQLFNAATTVILGNGCKASFWGSRWLNSEVPANVFPTLYKHSKRKNRTVREALHQNTWIKDVDHNMIQHIIAEFLALWDMIDGIALNEGKEDRIVWSLTSDGQYSAKSAYEVEFAGSASCVTAELTWRTKAPPKCRFFIWLLMRNRIWTAAHLQLRQWPIEYFCQLCYRNLETSTHLFMECPIARTIWASAATWASTPCLSPTSWEPSDSLKDWFINLSKAAPSSSREGTSSLFMLVCWEIWRERNRRIFRKECKSVPQILVLIQDEAAMWATAGNRGIQRLLSRQPLPDEHALNLQPPEGPTDGSEVANVLNVN